MGIYGERREPNEMGFSPGMVEMLEKARAAEVARLAAEQEAERNRPAPLTDDLRAVAQLAIARQVPTNVDVELDNYRLIGWRLGSHMLFERGAYRQYSTSKMYENFENYYETDRVGSLETVLEAVPEGRAWIVAQKSYLHGSIGLDDSMRVARADVVDRLTDVVDEKRGTEWLIDIESNAGDVYMQCAEPEHVRNMLSEFMVRRNIQTD